MVDNGSRDGSVDAAARRASRRARRRTRPGNVGYARAANLGTAATTAPVVAVLNADTELEPGTAGAMVGRARGRAAARARAARASATSTAPTIPRRRIFPSVLDRGRPRAARPVVADEPLHRALPPARRRSRASAARRLGVGRGDLAAPVRARRGRRLGRALLHVPGGHRPLLAAAPRRAGTSRTSRPAAVDARAGREHVAPALPDARSSTTARRTASRRSGSRAPAPFSSRSRPCTSVARAGWRWPSTCAGRART